MTNPCFNVVSFMGDVILTVNRTMVDLLSSKLGKKKFSEIHTGTSARYRTATGNQGAKFILMNEVAVRNLVKALETVKDGCRPLFAMCNKLYWSITEDGRSFNRLFVAANFHGDFCLAFSSPVYFMLSATLGVPALVSILADTKTLAGQDGTTYYIADDPVVTRLAAALRRVPNVSAGPLGLLADKLEQRLHPVSQGKVA
jgi:hypothetical protein